MSLDRREWNVLLFHHHCSADENTRSIHIGRSKESQHRSKTSIQQSHPKVSIDGWGLKQQATSVVEIQRTKATINTIVTSCSWIWCWSYVPKKFKWASLDRWSSKFSLFDSWRNYETDAQCIPTMKIIHRKCSAVRQDNKDKWRSLSLGDLVIGCNEPYTDYDSIFGGHLLDVLTCKKCAKVRRTFCDQKRGASFQRLDFSRSWKSNHFLAFYYRWLIG